MTIVNLNIEDHGSRGGSNTPLQPSPRSSVGAGKFQTDEILNIGDVVRVNRERFILCREGESSLTKIEGAIVPVRNFACVRVTGAGYHARENTIKPSIRKRAC